MDLSGIPDQLRSHMVQRLLYLDGNQFTLADYPFYTAIYDGQYTGLLLKCGRQVAKSTTICNFTIGESIGIPHFKTLFLSPSQEQTQRFSNTRLAKVVHYSPLVRRFFISKEFTDRTMLRMFKNGSEVTLSYACDNPDRARGVSADRVCYDKDAHVLTKRGWVYVSALQDTDLVADVSDTGHVEWNPPTHIFSKRHTGKMVTFKHAGFHQRVTGDHKMWVSYAVKTCEDGDAADSYHFIPAIDLTVPQGPDFKMTCRAIWPCTEDSDLTTAFPSSQTTGVPLQSQAETLQIAWLREGLSAEINARSVGDRLEYAVTVSAADIIFRRADFDREQRIHVDDVVDEEVYCFTVPNHRPIVKGNFSSRPIISSNCYDEVQDMLYESVIPVVNECMANSEYGYETYAGTPKTLENTIEYLWSLSTQTEWVMQCTGCNSYNFIESERSIGKHGPVCLKCDKTLNPRAGMWYDFNPGSTMKGFHISQPMLPRNMERPDRWQRIIDKLERYSENKFKNEVLGISDALGTRIISKGELEALCLDYDIYRHPPPGHRTNCSAVVAGIDWSGGGAEGVSRTVLWIWGITPEHRLKTLYFRIYPVTSPVSILEDVLEVLTAYGVNMVAGDRGEGHLANDLLAQRLGRHRVIQISYGAQAQPLTYNEKGGFYTADRTTLMDNYFMVLKRHGVEFPRLPHMTEPIKDTLNIFEEVTQMGKKVWRHAPTQPDDAFHAQLFGWVAAKIVMMDLDFTT